MTDLPAFDPNDYRKRVLAAVERRGGPDASDVFELYDLPLPADGADDLPDATVAARVAEVWAFWQRQRDHPKYRALVALLVEQHAARSAEVLDGPRRLATAARVRAQREQRDAERYALLDAAIARLVQRHGGVPADKVAGLVDVGALSGLSAEEVATRLRRHRTAAAPPGVPAARRRQIRALLDEFGRLTDVDPPPTLLALLGLPPVATPRQIAAGSGAWRSRARELPPGRLRAVVDELLVHVAELLEPGREAVAAYLDAVAADVAEYLRPRVRAAVLVEDRLVAEDHAHLLDEACTRGLDVRRARAVLAALAAEAGAEIETAGEPPVGAQPGTGRAEDPLKAVRAALRAGRPRTARRLLDAVTTTAAVDTPAARALSAEIDAVIAEAQLRYEAATAAGDDRRFVEALDHLEHLERVAADVADDLPARMAAARAAVAAADAAVAAARDLRPAEQAAALAAVLAACRDHAEARAALDGLPLDAPPWVSATRDWRGDVVVLWAPSRAGGVTYRVRRQRPDGAWQVVGRVTDNALEDGGAPPGVEAPVYAVAALAAGRTSPETRSDAAPPPSRPFRRAAPPAPARVTVVRAADGALEISWDRVAGSQVEYRVRREEGGRWRVVGRTRDTRMEDGGAPPGPPPVYAVSAAADGERSPEARSDGT